MTNKRASLTRAQWDLLSSVAWKARSAAYIIENTKVGASVLAGNGTVYSGCNVEHLFRSHDIHAETNAISSMIADGARNMRGILVVAERERFTPCGACLDWIFQFGGSSCSVGFQRELGGGILVLTAAELMPYYPR